MTTTPKPCTMPEEIFADDRSWYTAHPHMHPASYTLTRYVRADLVEKMKSGDEK